MMQIEREHVDYFAQKLAEEKIEVPLLQVHYLRWPAELCVNQ
ncbi:hypothetical protein [Desulfolucanica intricata]|nr:hypothetical protein [Desulfolucanica intricata]